MVELQDVEKKILEKALKEQYPVIFSGSELDISFQTLVVDYKEDLVLIENRIPPEYIRKFCASKNFQLLCDTIRFQVGEIRHEGRHIGFPLISNGSPINELRRSERFSFSPDERVFCEIINPFDGETKLTKAVMDMSATGLSLRTSFESMLFVAGIRLPYLRVLVDNDLYVQCVGQVVYRRKIFDLKGRLRMQVGIKFLESEAQTTK